MELCKHPQAASSESSPTLQAYYETAGKPGAGLDVEDVMLAVQAREAFTFTGPPPKHVRLVPLAGCWPQPQGNTAAMFCSGHAAPEHFTTSLISQPCRS